MDQILLGSVGSWPDLRQKIFATWAKVVTHETTYYGSFTVRLTAGGMIEEIIF